RFSDGLGAWKFALFAALCPTIPSVMYNYFLGVEFTSLLGGLTGLVIVVLAARKGFLLPKKVWDFPPRKDWLERWVGKIEPGDGKEAVAGQGRTIGFLNAWAPCMLVPAVLVISRTVTPLKEWLEGITLGAEDIFGTGI